MVLHSRFGLGVLASRNTEENRRKTALHMPNGLYEFETMPFGLTNGPASFQRLTQVALTCLPSNVRLCYIDIIIPRRSIQKHLEGISKNSKKHGYDLILGSVFLRKEMEFLRHVRSS